MKSFAWMTVNEIVLYLTFQRCVWLTPHLNPVRYAIVARRLANNHRASFSGATANHEPDFGKQLSRRIKICTHETSQPVTTPVDRPVDVAQYRDHR